MIAGSLSRRYARALHSIGVEKGNWEALGRQVDEVSALVAGSAELRQALTSPSFPLSQRRAVLGQVLARAAVAAVVRNFLLLLLERGRIAALPDIARELRVLVDEQAGRVRGELVTARPLAPELEHRIRLSLERRHGKKVLLERREDPSLLAGIVVRVGDTLYDCSLAAQLRTLRQTLLREA